MMRMAPADLVPHLQYQLRRMGIESQDRALLEGIVLAQRERSKTLLEMAQASRFFFVEQIEIDPKAAAKHLAGDAPALLGSIRERLAALPEWSAPQLHDLFAAYAAERSVGLGKVVQPVRVAVAGGPVSPPIDATLALLGRERTLARIDTAIRSLTP
jgi:glutamyl-tRNA synthetase